MHSKTIWKFTKCNENEIYCTRSRTKIPLNTINLNLIRECHLKNYLSGLSVFAFGAPYLSFSLCHSLGEWGIHVILWFFSFAERTHNYFYWVILDEEKKIGISLMSFFWDRQFLLATKKETVGASKRAWVSYLQYINLTSLAANFANATSLCMYVHILSNSNLWMRPHSCARWKLKAI